jgi:hypothetical protein
MRVLSPSQVPMPSVNQCTNAMKFFIAVLLVFSYAILALKPSLNRWRTTTRTPIFKAVNPHSLKEGSYIDPGPSSSIAKFRFGLNKTADKVLEFMPFEYRKDQQDSINKEIIANNMLLETTVAEYGALLDKIKNCHLEIEKGHLEIEKDLLEIRMDQLKIKKDLLEIEKDHLEIEKDHLEIEKDLLEIRMDQLKIKKDHLEIEKDISFLMTKYYKAMVASAHEELLSIVDNADRLQLQCQDKHLSRDNSSVTTLHSSDAHYILDDDVLDEQRYMRFIWSRVLSAVLSETETAADLLRKVCTEELTSTLDLLSTETEKPEVDDKAEFHAIRRADSLFSNILALLEKRSVAELL